MHRLFCLSNLLFTFLLLLPLHLHAQQFAIIGDYGNNSTASRRVAKLVKSWKPEFIITLGDNNYYRGYTRTIDRNIGKRYHCYIYPYHGRYGKGADTTRFFPSIGNHDVMTVGDNSYTDYFTLPGNERYYDFVWGNVHFFVLNSDPSEADGTTAGSKQGQWLQQRLQSSVSPWKVVYFHHPPYSSGGHGNSTWMQWPFREWGASVVLSGHDHTYERLERDGLTYIVNGLGGARIYPFQPLIPGSRFSYNALHGAMRAHATPTQLSFEFINRKKEVIDRFVLSRPQP